MREILGCLRVGLRENAILTNQELFFLEKAVFAESLVNALTLFYQNLPFRASIHYTYREKVYNHFSKGINNTVIYMMEIIDSEIEDIFRILKSANCLNYRKYMDYAKDISKKYAEEDFEPRKFLYFCVHVTKLALNFYTEGVREAPEYAFQAILHGLRAFDINRIGWNSFKFLAEGYSPSAEAIVSTSCVTTVCDTVPMLDSIQKLQVTSDEASSSEETVLSSDEESLLFLPKKPSPSPVGKAVNTCLLSFANKVNWPTGDQQSSCQFSSQEPIVSKSTLCNSVPTINSVQRFKVTNDEVSYNGEMASSSGEKDLFYLLKRPGLPSVSNAAHTYLLPLTNQIVGPAADQQSSSQFLSEFCRPSSEAIVSKSFVTTSYNPNPTIDSIQGLQATSDEASYNGEMASSSSEKDLFHLLKRPGLSSVSETANTNLLPLTNQIVGTAKYQQSSCQFLSEFCRPSSEAIVSKSCVTTSYNPNPTIDSIQGLQVTSDEASSNEEMASPSDEKDLFFLSKRQGLSPVGEVVNAYFLSLTNQIITADQPSSSKLSSEFQSSHGPSENTNMMTDF